LGHEIDRSVADEIAHLSLKTPTACAGALIDRVRRFSEQAERAWQLVSRRVDTALDGASRSLDRAGERAIAGARRHLDMAGARLDGYEGHVRALDPTATLARGWSITRTAAGALVRSTGDAQPGELLVTTVADGQLTSRVEP
jgi:exodeoxyribonuclease VII large subunit